MRDAEPYTLDLSEVIRLSDEELFKICAANPNLRIERNAEGHLEIRSLGGQLTGAREAVAVARLASWNGSHGRGMAVTASAGFLLPNTAMRAAAAAWIPLDRLTELSEAGQEKFTHLVPDFVVEIRSPSDRLAPLRAKMKEWIDNGCRLAWLLDPLEKTATIYRADGTTENRPFDSTLSGENVLPGFECDLRTLP